MAMVEITIQVSEEVDADGNPICDVRSQVKSIGGYNAELVGDGIPTSKVVSCGILEFLKDELAIHQYAKRAIDKSVDGEKNGLLGPEEGKVIAEEWDQSDDA